MRTKSSRRFVLQISLILLLNVGCIANVSHNRVGLRNDTLLENLACGIHINVTVETLRAAIANMATESQVKTDLAKINELTALVERKTELNPDTIFSRIPQDYQLICRDIYGLAQVAYKEDSSGAILLPMLWGLRDGLDAYMEYRFPKVNATYRTNI